jgi:predicted membrane channel-forming protein YqfA (hemolysin III family)
MPEPKPDPVSDPAAGSTPTSAAAKLFDIRLLIGALFTLYGVMLTVAGLFTSSSAKHKASDININLWLGIGMLVVGLLFLLWRQLSPLKIEPNPADQPADQP